MQPTPVLLPGKSHGQRSLGGCSPWGHKKNWTRLPTKLQQHRHRYRYRTFLSSQKVLLESAGIRNDLKFFSMEFQTLYNFIPVYLIRCIFHYTDYMWPMCPMGLFFPDSSSACNAGDPSSILGWGRYPGEGTGYPLQYSGLENSMDCLVHGVAKSRTWLSDFHFTRILYFCTSEPLLISFPQLIISFLFIHLMKHSHSYTDPLKCTFFIKVIYM